MSNHFLIDCDKETGNFVVPEAVTGLMLICDATKNCGLYLVD